MAQKPDKVVAIDQHGELVVAWLQAQENAKRWNQVAADYEARLQQLIGDHTAATIAGHTVITYRPIDRYRTTDLRKAYPDLTERFVREKTSVAFDVTAFAAAHPDLAAQFRTRVFRGA